MGRSAWMYVSSARVSGGRDGAVGREMAAATSRRDVASRSMATTTIPTRTSSTAAIRMSLRRENLEERVSVDGIIASSVSTLRTEPIRYSASNLLSISGHRNAWALD